LEEGLLRYGVHRIHLEVDFVISGLQKWRALYELSDRETLASLRSDLEWLSLERLFRVWLCGAVELRVRGGVEGGGSGLELRGGSYLLGAEFLVEEGR